MNVLYETNCGHLVAQNPASVNLHEWFTCRHCGTETCISGVQIMEYRAHCQQCGWSRYCGMSARMAGEVANKHARNGHGEVKAEWAVNPRAKMERERIQKGNLL